MLAKEITSLQHPIVKFLVKLRGQKKIREEKQQVLIAGIKQVSEAKTLDILLTKKGTELDTTEPREHYFVTDSILKKISGLETPEPAVGVVPMPKWTSLEGKQWILALDEVNDPGNLGTLLRTALALGWEGIYLTEKCVDPYNEKALRSSMGATFRLPMRQGSASELIEFAKNQDGPVWIADMDGTPLPQISPPQKALLILGNEAVGVRQELKIVFKKISIPIKQIESLNVAAAGAILMYTLKT